MKATALGLLLVLAACGSPAETASLSPLATATPTAPAAIPDLAEILVPADAPPTDLSHDYTEEGISALTRVVISGRAPESLALEGFVEGRFSGFSGDAGVLLSLALLFETVEQAEVALDLYLDEFHSEDGYGFTGSPAGLGDEGECGEGDNPSLGWLHESMCIWRHGQLVLIVGGTLSPGETHAIAEGMDARAD